MLHELLEIDPLAPSHANYVSNQGLAAQDEFDDTAIADETDASFADRLLAALATMAVRSKRRQADLSAALRRAGLDGEAGLVSNALRYLEDVGCIEHLVPLYDGGVLMSVTSRGIEQLSSAPRWTLLDGTGYHRSSRAF
jgi:hypothetical protein